MRLNIIFWPIYRYFEFSLRTVVCYYHKIK